MTEVTECLLFTPLSVDRDGGRGASSQLPPSPDSGETTHAQSTKLSAYVCEATCRTLGDKDILLDAARPSSKGGF